MQQWPIFRNSARASRRLLTICFLSPEARRVCEVPPRTLRLAVTHSRLACAVQERSAEAVRAARKKQSEKTDPAATGDPYPLSNTFGQKLIPAPATPPDYLRQPVEQDSRFVPPERQAPHGRLE